MGAAHGFFKDRRRPDLGVTVPSKQIDFAEYVNVAPVIGTVVSRKMATIHELDTVYGMEDVYNMLEIMAVDDFNQTLLRKAQ